MIQFKTHASILLVFCATACATAEPPPPPSDPRAELAIERHTTEQIDGAFVRADARLQFSAARVGERRATVALRLGAKVIDIDVDYAAGSANHDAHGATFTAPELALIGAAAEALAAELPDGPNRSEVEGALAQQVAFMAKAPAAMPIQSFKFQHDRSVTCISCACGIQNIGNGFSRQAGQGAQCTGGSGNGCKGHCGAGCDPGNTGNYTRDCARHDYGLASWWTAADDYAFGGCWCF